MARLLGWITRGSEKVFDPDRRARIERAAARLERQLATRRATFVLKEALRDLEVPATDVPHAVREAYRSLVGRAWRNGQLSAGEHDTLDWAATQLQLDPATSHKVRQEIGLQAFEALLARAIDDGAVDEREQDALQRSARSLGFPLDRLIREYFTSKCEALVRGVFLRCLQDGRLLADEWARVASTAERLGLGRDELLTVIQKPAEQFVQRTLAEAKADGCLTPEECTQLDWLLAHLIGRPAFLVRVRSEMSAIKHIEPVREGYLPSVKSNRLGLRAGEIVHAQFPAEYVRTRRLRSGPLVERIPGTVVLTDHRMLFDAKRAGFEVPHGRVRDIQISPNGFMLTAGVKGSGFYAPARDAESLGRMYRVAVRRARQTAR